MKCWEVDGNFWSKSKYSKAQALELSKSLINCRNCIDCLNCVNCSDCISCYGCENCGSCVECINCKECKSCIDCIDCLRCGACVGLSHNLELNYGRGGNIKGDKDGTF